MSFDPTVEIIFRLGMATIVGGLIGLNREIRHKPAGLRTHALVALGAAVATALVAAIGSGVTAQHFDALSRVIQGIITGIGFLGAGVILRAENGRSVHGLTTAASIWLAACLGSACGAGAWVITLCALVLVLLILIVGGPLDHWLRSHLKTHQESPPVE
jgi:putative Mg2+ transporter-C (MgtC) family protein